MQIEKPIKMEEMHLMLNICENTFRYTMLKPLLKLQETMNIDIGIIPRKTQKRIQYMFQPQKFIEALKLLNQENFTNKEEIGSDQRCLLRKNIQDWKKEKVSSISMTMSKRNYAVSQLKQILG